MNINRPALRKKGQLQYGNKPVKIILHHPVFNGSAEMLNEIEINNKSDPKVMSGYHFYVRKDGAVYAMRPVEAIGAHCYGQNSISIGVAFEGNFMVDDMSEAQFNSGVELCRYLMKSYPGIKEVSPHKKYYNTDCPGDKFPINKMISLLSNSGYSIKYLQHELNVQFNAGIAEDNIAGPVTLSKCPVIKIGASGNITRWVQVRLGISQDGIFGSKTKSAVVEFQSKNGLVTDGIVGQNTWRKLLGL